jgi:hypothetical protein
MTTESQPRPLVGLEQMAQAKFSPLSESESRLVRAAMLGEIAHCGPNDKDDDPANDPADAANWGPERSIRAELIRWLCVDRDARALLDSRGIRVYAAQITGKFELPFVAVPFTLGFLRCSLWENVDFQFMDISSLDWTGTCLPSLNLDHVTVKGSVTLQGLRSTGLVQLCGARIGANLECDGGKFQNPAQANAAWSGVAIDATNAKVEGAVLLRDGFAAEGAVRLFGATIGETLDCGGGTFQNPAQKDIKESGVALDATNASVAGNVLLRGQFAAEGMVGMYGAQIGGNLDCEGGTFRNPALQDIAGSGLAIEATNLKVSGAVSMRKEFAAEGQVWMYGARIDGNLDCDGGTFHNPSLANVPQSGLALNMEGVTVGEAVFLRGSVADGTVRMFAAHIGGNLECDGAKLRNRAKASALDAEGAKIDGNVYLRTKFSAKGDVRLYSTRIDGDLECEGGVFESLDLRNATARSLLDDQASWPKFGKLSLDGFTYGRIASGPDSARERLGWLARQQPFTRFPYRQLAGVFRQAGDVHGWRLVSREMERRTWAAKAWYKRPAGWVLGATIGYGYSSLTALWWLLALVLAGSAVYRLGYQAGSMVPVDQAAYDSFVAHKNLPGNYPAFYSLPYSLENSFPVVKLGVQDKWAPAPNQRAAAQPVGPSSSLLVRMASPRFLQPFRWIQICLGWILGTLFVSGVTGIVRND